MDSDANSESVTTLVTCDECHSQTFAVVENVSLQVFSGGYVRVKATKAMTAMHIRL